MIESIKNFFRPLIPRKVFVFFQPAYHYGIALFAAILYGFPSRRLRVVAITGTKGKTSTAEIINAILEEAGKKTALIGSLRVKLDNESKPNPYGMSMPGLGRLQKFLHEAVETHCDWAIMEMTSEGAKQFRHKFIDLDAFIFTNLAPEHIESHGSFEQYLAHKQRIATLLSDSHKSRRVAIINNDDEYAEQFVPMRATEVIRYQTADAGTFASDETGITMRVDGVTMHSPLVGAHNVSNILAAVAFARAFGIDMPVISRAVSKLKTIRGRGERVEAGQDFTVIVDYAHTIESLEALYKTFPSQRKICVLGNTGGGRDTWKRPGMARVADTYCDEIILTTEDPYDEDPQHIIDDMLPGIAKHKPTIIIDRREAIAKAIDLAVTGDVVLMSGMGSQQYMSIANGKKIPWSDAEVAREELEKRPI